MNLPKDKKNLVVIALLAIAGLLVVYYFSVRPMIKSKASEEVKTEANVVEELPTAKPIDIMGKGINGKVEVPTPEEEELVGAMYQEQQQAVAEGTIPPEYDVPITNNASDQERMMRIMELQDRYRNNTETFAIEMARQQAEQEKAAIQREANTYKELYEQSVSDNNQLANRVKSVEEERKSQKERQWLRVTAKRGEVVSSLGADDTSKSPFHGGGTSDKQGESSLRNALKATIQQTITVKDGDILPLRLTEDAYAGNVTLRAGTVVNGVVRLTGSRLEVVVSSIEYRGRIMAVNLSVYDVDAQKGIYVPEGDMAQVASDAVSALGDGVLQASTSSTQGFTVNQSAKDAVVGVVARGAVAGLGSILKGKQRIPTVTIQSGYRLFLINE